MPVTHHNPDGVFPPYRAYCGHIRTILGAAGMEIGNIVSLRTYLSDPKYDEQNVRMRVKHMGSHRAASTVVCCQLLEPRWKLEVELVAAT